LHGLRGFSGTWRTLAAALSGDYRLLALDQRGRGESDWDPHHDYYTDAYLADLEVLVDRFRLSRFALVGHSMGGTTSYAYADRHPQQLVALVVEDMAPGSSVAGAGAERIVAEMEMLPSGFSSWREAREYWRAKRPTLSAAALEARAADSLRQLPEGKIVWRYDAAGIRATRLRPDPKRILDLWPIVERLRVPTLVIRGAHSDFCPVETVQQMCKLNPRISAITVPGASHYVHDDAPAEYIAHVGRFLAAQFASH
jgi:pimeloyl-ACP methyl ester carboxylesterase